VGVIVLLEGEYEETPQKLLPKEERNNYLENRRKKIENTQDDVLSTVQLSGKSPQFKLRHKYKILNGFAGEATIEGLLELQKNKKVKKIFLNRKVQVSLQNAVPVADVDDVWKINVLNENITGSGETICIIDTGIYYDHTDLGGPGFPNKKILAGYDYVNDDNNPWDDHGHGSHVAGIAAANGSVVGVAPSAKIVALKALDSSGSGNFYDIIDAMEWCVYNSTEYNISVISMSFGIEGVVFSAECDATYPYNLTTPIVNLAYSMGIIGLAASGNDYSSLGVTHPACHANVTSVGASDNSDVIASFSNTGAILDILAPGVSVVSTVPPASACTGGSTICNDATYKALSGTSMSTPYAAGIAALVLQYSRLQNGVTLLPNETAYYLNQTDTNITDPDNNLSFPRVNALIAVNSIPVSVRFSNYSNNLTTNFSQFNKTELENLSNITIGNPNSGIINFTNQSINLLEGSDIDDYIVISDNYIFIDSTKLPNFNKTAILTLFNLQFTEKPVVFKDGSVCSSCEIIDYAGGNFIFRVDGFSAYSSGANSNLTIWDETDSSMPYADQIRYINQQVYFFANYANITSGEIINSTIGYCNITVNDTINDGMTFSAAKQLFEFNRNFASNGTFQWSVVCNASGFEQLNATDTVVIIADTEPPSINLVSPGNNTFDIDGNLSFVYQANNSGSGIQNCSLYINNALNQTDFTVGEGINQNFTLNNTADGIYAWNITCFDNSSNYKSNSSETRNVKVDTSEPVVNLENPSNNTLENSSSTVIFEYNVSDTMTNISNCSLILNGLNNATNNSVIESTTQSFAITLPNAQYNWSISCYDSNGFLGSSVIYNLTIDVPETNPPTIALVSPANNAIDKDGDINFVFNVTDDTGIENCSVLIEGTINKTDTSITMGADQSFLVNDIKAGQYDWSIRCYDSSPNNNVRTSSERGITVAICGDGTVNGNEECDGNNFKGKTCSYYSFDSGTLSCSTSCKIVTLGCTVTTVTAGAGGGLGVLLATCAEKWSCTEWNECSPKGIQIRTCTDENKCNTTEKKPEEQRKCVPAEVTEEKAEELIEEEIAGEEAAVFAEEVEEKTKKEKEIAAEEEKPAIVSKFKYSYLWWPLLIQLPVLIFLLIKFKIVKWPFKKQEEEQLPPISEPKPPKPKEKDIKKIDTSIESLSKELKRL
jgi:hypothetical protein